MLVQRLGRHVLQADGLVQQWLPLVLFLLLRPPLPVEPAARLEPTPIGVVGYDGGLTFDGTRNGTPSFADGGT